MTMQVRKPRRPRPSGRRGCCPALEQAVDPRLFRALGDPTRIQILVQLTRCCSPQTVTQAAACCAVDLSVVSRHLAILRDAGVLSVRKQDRRVLYSVRYGELVQTLRALADAIEACCPDKPHPPPRRRCPRSPKRQRAGIT